MTVHFKACTHAGDYRLRGAEFCFDRRGVCIDINNVLGEALALDSDDSVVCCRRDRDDVKAYRGGDNAAAVVVCVVARKLASACDREYVKLTLFSVEGCKLIYCLYVSLASRRDVLPAVEHAKFFIKSAFFYLIYELNRFHKKNPFGIVFHLLI